MNRLGGKSNTGEGGEDPERFKDERRSSIKQVASGRFGVTVNYLVNADELQIKVAQGAKPGEGGQLPGHKVDRYIARLRHSTPGVGLISPPPHHDIYSIEDLKQLIYDLRCANPRARVSVKLVSEVGVGTVAAGVAKANADHVVIAGHDGGTGASPQASIHHAGIPWEIGLAETQQTLLRNDLRSRILVEVDGQMRTGRDVVIGAILGADEFGFSTAPLIALGCVMMRVCHLNTCPVGVATQDPELRARFEGQPEHVVNYLFMVAEEARRLMAKLGVRTVDQLIGRTELLEAEDAVDHWKARGVDLTPLLAVPENVRAGHSAASGAPPRSGPLRLDRRRPAAALPAGDRGRPAGPARAPHREQEPRGRRAPVRRDRARPRRGGPARGQHRGAAGGLCRPELRRLARERGRAAPRGRRQRLLRQGPLGRHGRGAAAGAADFVAEDNVIVGNTVLYGATSGRAFFRGLAGERFAVRNSGAITVVEGVGDHGCEYMTGGRVVVLGPTGLNFAAGMSGGIAYVLDVDGGFRGRCNTELVGFDAITPDEEEELRGWIEEHCERTGSGSRSGVLADWAGSLNSMVKVMPHDYRRALAEASAEGEAEVAAAAAGPMATPGYAAAAPHGPTSPADVPDAREERELMGELGGFLRLERVGFEKRDPHERVHDYQQYFGLPDGACPARPGRALHGLRRALLPRGLPAREPDPGLERPRLPRPVARRARSSSTRPTTSPSSPA